MCLLVNLKVILEFLYHLTRTLLCYLFLSSGYRAFELQFNSTFKRRSQKLVNKVFINLFFHNKENKICLKINYNTYSGS